MRVIALTQNVIQGSVSYAKREEKVRAVRVRQKVSDRSGNEANKER